MLPRLFQGCVRGAAGRGRWTTGPGEARRDHAASRADARAVEDPQGSGGCDGGMRDNVRGIDRSILKNQLTTRQMNSTEIAVREIEPADREWVRSFLGRHFGSTKVVSRGIMHQADGLPGFIAMYRGEPGALLDVLCDERRTGGGLAPCRYRRTRARLSPSGCGAGACTRPAVPKTGSSRPTTMSPR